MSCFKTEGTIISHLNQCVDKGSREDPHVFFFFFSKCIVSLDSIVSQSHSSIIRPAIIIASIRDAAIANMMKSQVS